jgi:hypothetical protein
MTARNFALSQEIYLQQDFVFKDRLCGLVVRVPGYRSGGPRFDSRHYKEKVVSLERGPLSPVSTTEELLGSNSSGFGLGSREYDRRDFFYYYSYILFLASG